MGTDISVHNVSLQVESRKWLKSNFGCDEPRSVVIDVSAFTAGTHYVNGFIPSGIVLAQITATGLYGPYNNGGAGGLEVAKGHLFSLVKIPSLTNTAVDVGGAMLEMGLIDESELPFGGGAGQIDTTGKIDSAGKIDLINWFKYL